MFVGCGVQFGGYLVRDENTRAIFTARKVLVY